MAARCRIAITPKGGATSSAVATMPGSVRRSRRPMNAVIAPASASAAAAAAKEPSDHDRLRAGIRAAQSDHDERGEGGRDSAISPNVANACA